MNRRDFITGAGCLAAAAWAVDGRTAEAASPQAGKRALPITGTFLDEISHDIPHQNWGEREWNRDFELMKAVGIRDVYLIRAGHRKFLTYPSEVLMAQGCYRPGEDLVEMFLRLADRHDMNFWFGLYDPGKEHPLSHYAEVNMAVVEEAWRRYGHHPSFKGWYVSSEFSRRREGCVEAVRRMGRQCKDVSGGLPTFISPYMDGKKAVSAYHPVLGTGAGVSISEHEKEWSEILDGVKGTIDACAFQDGHIGYDELDAFFTVNKRLADRFGIACWTNAESFDRDMPIKFLPIKFEKLRLKLEAAKRCGYDKAITFEFSHFMSPQSMYPSAAHLYDRYVEYLNGVAGTGC